MQQNQQNFKPAREIKFRVWHNGRMYRFSKEDDYQLIFFRKGLIPWGIYDMNTEARLVTGDQSAILNEPGVLMQYTGLKDQYGNELWEGDILKFTLEDDLVEFGVIRFSEDGFWTSQSENHQEELLSDELNSKLNYQLFGNIYEDSSALAGLKFC